MDLSHLSRVIFLEGLDASGKRTQAELLGNHMRGHGIKTEIISLPCDWGPWGRVIRAHLGNELSSSLSPDGAAAGFSLDRLSLISICQEMRGEGISLIFDRSHLSNAYNIARAVLEGQVEFSLEKTSPFMVWVDRILKLDRIFRETVSRWAFGGRIFYDMVPEFAVDLLLQRRKLEGRELDLHEANFNLQKLTSEIYYVMINFLSEKGERWDKFPMMLEPGIFSGDDNWRLRSRLGMAGATHRYLLASGIFDFPFDEEAAQREWPAEGYRTFEERVLEKVKLTTEDSGYLLPSEHLREMEKLAFFYPGLEKAFLEVHGRPFDEVFMAKESSREPHQELAQSRGLGFGPER